MQKLQILRRLPAAVWLVGLTSMLNDMAGEMLYPVLPLYVASVLGAGPRGLGLIEGIADATTSLLRLFSGIVVDRTRRAKPWIVSGYSLAGAARPLIALVTSWPAVLFLRFADRLGKGLRSSPRDEIITVSVSPSQRGLAFGIHRALDNTGAVLGPLLCWALLESGLPMRQLFIVAIVPGALAVIFACLIREPGRPATSAPVGMDWSLRGFDRLFLKYLVAVALFSLAGSSNMFLLLRARELGFIESRIPLLWGGVSLVAALFSAPLSAISDTIGRTRMISFGWLAYGFFYCALAFLTSAGTWLILLFLFYGLFAAATEGVEKALVADLAPAGRVGTAFGWFHLTCGFMLFPASFVFGFLYQDVSPRAACLFSAICALLALGVLIFGVAPGLRAPRNAGESGRGPFTSEERAS